MCNSYPFPQEWLRRQTLGAGPATCGDSISLHPCSLPFPTVGTTACSSHEGLCQGERGQRNPQQQNWASAWHWWNKGRTQRLAAKLPVPRFLPSLPASARPSLEPGPERGGDWPVSVKSLSMFAGSRIESIDRYTSLDFLQWQGAEHPQNETEARGLGGRTSKPCSCLLGSSLLLHKLFPPSPNLCPTSSLLFTSQLEGHLGSFWSPWCIPLPGHLRSLHPDPSSALIFTSACYAHLLTCIFRATSLLVPEFVRYRRHNKIPQIGGLNTGNVFAHGSGG